MLYVLGMCTILLQDEIDNSVLESRMIRAEQNKAYEESLAADRAKVSY